MASSRLFAATCRPVAVAASASLFAVTIGTSNTNNTHCDDDSFPNLSRHGQNSLLREFLTPEIYKKLKDKKTCHNVTLEDIIRSGTCLPHGALQPGVFAGDAESYTVFADLLDPIIDRHHRRNRENKYSVLQRFQTNLNPGLLLQTRLDQNGAYILYTRMRLARSIVGFRFPSTMDRKERRKIEMIIKNAVKSWKGEYRSIMEMQNKKHDDLIRLRVLFADPDVYTTSAGLGRDWPDSRGIYADTWVTTPKIFIWVNAPYDHVSIISNTKGGDVQGVFTNLSDTVSRLEKQLKSAGYSFVEDKRLGFLNSRPADIGTALRASVVIKLVRLGKLDKFEELMRKLRLSAKHEEKRGKRYSGIFDIGNAEALGKTEVQLINIMIRGVEICIDLERRLEMGEEIDIDDIPEL